MNIVLACGGSGGHIFPAIALARKLSKKVSGSNIILIGTNREVNIKIFKGLIENKWINNQEKIKLDYIQDIRLESFLPLTILIFLIKLFNSFIWSIRLIKKFKPQVVIGFGGYASFPLLLLSSFNRKIYTLIVEQNLILGKANKILSVFVEKVACSFEDTANLRFKQKFKFTGLPIRGCFLLKSNLNQAEAKKTLGLDNNKFTILVMGGSQGARDLNINLIRALSEMRKSKLSLLQIIHISGCRDYSLLENFYKKLGINFLLYDFLLEIELAYIAADLTVTRAGASTLAELNYLGIPCILIPHPYRNLHQEENARYIEKYNAAIVLRQDKNLPTRLKEKLHFLINNKDILSDISKNFKNLKIADTEEKLCREIIYITDRHR